MERQFTASVYILQENKVLLIYHRKLKKWIQPGGHIDPNEVPTIAAKREALEETGLEIELISQENVWLDCWNAKSIERPYLCLLEEIPEHKGYPAHQHIDLIYLGKPVGGTLIENVEETGGLRWFTLEEVEALREDVDVFGETQQVLRVILSPANIASQTALDCESKAFVL